MPEFRIEKLDLLDQQGADKRVFHPYADALCLVMHLYASPDLVALPGSRFTIEFQVIDVTSDAVLVRQGWLGSFNLGSYFWLSAGNNWGPSTSDYDTPEKWGLISPQRANIYGFRGIVRATANNESACAAAWDVSEIAWFRIRELWKL